MLPDLYTDFSRGRSGGLVFPSLSEFSTVYCDPHSQRLWHSQYIRNRCFSGTLLLFRWSSRYWQFDLWFLCLFWNQLNEMINYGHHSFKLTVKIFSKLYSYISDFPMKFIMMLGSFLFLCICKPNFSKKEMTNNTWPDNHINLHYRQIDWIL